MKEGKIVEEGTHKDLFFQNGLYKNLIKNQVDEFGELLIKRNIQIKTPQKFKKELIRKRSLILLNDDENQNGNLMPLSIKTLFLIVKKKII